MDGRILYVTFVDMDKNMKTASSVRPQKIYHAFQDMGVEVKLLSGPDNQYKDRKENVKDIMAWLEKNRPKMCYIEPPSGPFLCPYDLKLLKILKKKEIPISIFYRDAYWKFPYMGIQKMHILNKLKQRVVYYMQKRDWKVIEKTCSRIYFPSVSLAEYFVHDNISILPPGCELIDIVDTRNKEDEIPTAIYVGGVTERYGAYLLLDAFSKMNESRTYVKLNIICPKEQWECLPLEYQKCKLKGWLKVNHISGKENLKELYQKSDFAVLPLKKNDYNDVAVPVKLFEYVSHLKPIISTNCDEMAQIVRENNVGLVVDDNTEQLIEGISKLLNDNDQFQEYKKNCKLMRENNTWNKRVETIMQDAYQ